MKSARNNFHRFAAPKRIGKRRGGFTLVEVLATLIILGVSALIMEGIGMTARAATTSQERAQAAALAESKLNELIALGTWQTGATGGNFDESPKFTWTAEVNSWNQSLGVNGTNTLQELDVHVLWTTGSTQQSITVSTLVYPIAHTAQTTTTTGGSS